MNVWLKAKSLALKRRLSILLTGGFNPYPAPPDDVRLSPSEAHAEELKNAPLKLNWKKAADGDIGQWQEAARDKLIELTGYRRNDATPESLHEKESVLPNRLLKRSLYLGAWPGSHIPVHLVWDKEATSPMPVMICVQGTNSGTHLSWGEERMPADPIKISIGLDFANQSAQRGYLAVCVESICFGERIERKIDPVSADPCIDTSNHALLMGRTLVGERASDISRVIDWLSAGGSGFDLDFDRIHALGHSSGGTTVTFTTALDTRINAAIASGCVGYMRETLAKRRDSAGQNTVPGILNWFEFDDMLAMIAPRPLLVVSGTRDHIWPFHQGEAVVENVKEVYEKLKAPGAIAAVSAEGPHRFYPEVTWKSFEKLLHQDTAE